MSAVFVTNHNAKPYRDRYDGQDYVFAPNEAVAVPAEAATLFFGYKLDDKSEALQRVGKSFRVDPETGQYGDDPAGISWLAKFTFEEAVLQPVSALAQALKAQQVPAVAAPVTDARTLL
jgi:hypothetical protein